MVETGSLKRFQNRPGPVQEKCCLKKGEIFGLTLFWYSPTYLKKFGSIKTCDIIKFILNPRNIKNTILSGNGQTYLP